MEYCVPKLHPSHSISWQRSEPSACSTRPVHAEIVPQSLSSREADQPTSCACVLHFLEMRSRHCPALIALPPEDVPSIYSILSSTLTMIRRRRHKIDNTPREGSASAMAQEDGLWDVRISRTSTRLRIWKGGSGSSRPPCCASVTVSAVCGSIFPQSSLFLSSDRRWAGGPRHTAT